MILPDRGYVFKEVALPTLVRECVVACDWNALDQAIRLEADPGGSIFEALRAFTSFTEIEFIISIRSSLGEPDEDGIWHDDGSRILAFSLSLTLDPDSIEGGRLGLRKRGAERDPEPQDLIPTPPYGTMIVFATGHLGFEHRIHRVASGERIIIAGWCT